MVNDSEFIAFLPKYDNILVHKCQFCVELIQYPAIFSINGGHIKSVQVIAF